MEQAQLINKAKEASLKSYSPYSNFKVGVALEDHLGNVFTGCNIENRSFPAGSCAEVIAIGKAISETGPLMKIKQLVVYTPTQTLTTPCGTCRQVINEFATPETNVICASDGSETIVMPFAELFPDSPIIEGL